MAVFKGKQTGIQIEKGSEQKYTKELNNFYSRFDCFDLSDKIKEIKNDLNENSEETIQVKQYEVFKIFTSLKTNKARGPNDLTKHAQGNYPLFTQ